MSDVRTLLGRLFTFQVVAGVAILALGVALAFRPTRRRLVPRALRLGALLTLGLAVLVGILSLVYWPAFSTPFHLVFFGSRAGASTTRTPCGGSIPTVSGSTRRSCSARSRSPRPVRSGSSPARGSGARREGRCSPRNPRRDDQRSGRRELPGRLPRPSRAADGRELQPRPRGLRPCARTPRLRRDHGRDRKLPRGPRIGRPRERDDRPPAGGAALVLPPPHPDRRTRRQPRGGDRRAAPLAQAAAHALGRRGRAPDRGRQRHDAEGAPRRRARGAPLRRRPPRERGGRAGAGGGRPRRTARPLHREGRQGARRPDRAPGRGGAAPLPGTRPAASSTAATGRSSSSTPAAAR